MAKYELPDLRVADPLRKDITPETAVFDDVTDAVVEATKALARFEDTLESRNATVAIREIDNAIRVLQYFKRRVADERFKLNKIERYDRIAR